MTEATRPSTRVDQLCSLSPTDDDEFQISAAVGERVGVRGTANSDGSPLTPALSAMLTLNGHVPLIPLDL